MQFNFVPDHGGRKIASSWLTYSFARMENNINDLQLHLYTMLCTRTLLF